jgi:purine-binding chemotaxis protein CheW
MAEPLRLNKRSAQIPAHVEERNQYLAFMLGKETFAMDIRFIKEIIQYSSLTEVPLMPPFIRGVINLRGSVVPVIDLSVRFGRDTTNIAHRTCIVVLEVQNGEGTVVLGAIVDHVDEVLELAPSDIEAAPTFGSDLRPEFISGIGKVGGRFVILLDVNNVLSIEELASLASGREATPTRS